MTRARAHPSTRQRKDTSCWPACGQQKEQDSFHAACRCRIRELAADPAGRRGGEGAPALYHCRVRGGASEPAGWGSGLFGPRPCTCDCGFIWHQSLWVRLSQGSREDINLGLGGMPNPMTRVPERREGHPRAPGPQRPGPRKGKRGADCEGTNARRLAPSGSWRFVAAAPGHRTQRPTCLPPGLALSSRHRAAAREEPARAQPVPAAWLGLRPPGPQQAVGGAQGWGQKGVMTRLRKPRC